MAKEEAKKKEIELLTPKQNGSVDDDQDKKNPSTIRGMWRKAFKTLKSSSSVEKLSKKSSFSKKKQNSKDADDEVEQLNSGPVDPVYSLLKCAADLPRSGGKSPCPLHAHCSGQHGAGGGYTRYPSGGDSSGNTSKTSSPSSSALVLRRDLSLAIPNNATQSSNQSSPSFYDHIPHSPDHSFKLDDYSPLANQLSEADACCKTNCSCDHGQVEVDYHQVYSKIQNVQSSKDEDEESENKPPSFRGLIRCQSNIST